MIKQLLILIIIFSLNVYSQILKFEDRMNGDNSAAGLQARGWVILDQDGGGFDPPWFQGKPSVFTSLEGPDSGYVGSNYNGANLNDVVDQWLISPAINVIAGDSLSFFARSPSGSTFDDSIHILISVTGGTSPSDFVSLGRFLVSKLGWQGFYVIFNTTSTIRFAVRYYLQDANTNANFIGLDLFQLYTYQAYPLLVTVSKTFSFSDITHSSSYRMVSLPGDINHPLSVPGTQKTDWNAFYDNGASTNYLVEYSAGSTAFNFQPGNGFWLLSKNSVSINTVVNSVSLDLDNTYSIPLNPGWNIISNPFERSTSWTTVQSVNGLAGNAVIYDWNGSWTNPNTFIPYKGYYFNNTNSLSSLKIPYDPSGILAKTAEDVYLKVSSDKELKLTLDQDEHVKSEVSISFDKTSSSDFDVLDYFAPPGDFEEARIVIHNEKLSTNHKFLMRDSRTEIGDGQEYDLEIKNTSGRNLTLKVQGVSNFRDKQIYLVDKYLNNELKISEDAEIEIKSLNKMTNFKLYIGSESFIEANKPKLTPTKFELCQNYPNPFNPNTSIRYSVANDVNVSIKLFDVLGNEIRTLVDEQTSAGNYEIEVDASDLASGIYIYKITAGSYTESKKMLLLR
ncbi:MAG: T9SS type A sorting domain-containing protein [Ignavibacteriaceae bacterium]|nr:T9SS type A sorting domain-containing protein [Ignavibacteriaceae bacterium]